MYIETKASIIGHIHILIETAIYITSNLSIYEFGDHTSIEIKKCFFRKCNRHLYINLDMELNEYYLKKYEIQKEYLNRQTVSYQSNKTYF